MNIVLAINKPKGMTSFDVVKKIAKTHGVKAGHSGTLDPMATGVLLVGINKATKLLPYLMESRKTYRAEITFGIATDSKDITGTVIDEADVPLITQADCEQALQLIQGKQKQQVPKVSAVKVKGKPLYKHREDVALPVRTIEVFESKYHSHTERTLTYEVEVSKGTYVRVLSETIAAYLNTIGTTSALTRLKNKATLGQCQSLESALKQPIALDFYSLMQDYPIIDIDDPTPVYHGKRMAFDIDADLVCLFYDKQPIGMYRRVDGHQFRSERGLF